MDFDITDLDENGTHITTKARGLSRTAATAKRRRLAIWGSGPSSSPIVRDGGHWSPEAQEFAGAFGFPARFTIKSREIELGAYPGASSSEALEAMIAEAGGEPAIDPAWTDSIGVFQGDASIDFLILRDNLRDDEWAIEVLCIETDLDAQTRFDQATKGYGRLEH